MAKRNRYSYKKLQKELKRRKKAKEKLERRQGNEDQVTEVDGTWTTEQEKKNEREV